MLPNILLSGLILLTLRVQESMCTTTDSHPIVYENESINTNLIMSIVNGNIIIRDYVQ